jgi:serralysin
MTLSRVATEPPSQSVWLSQRDEAVTSRFKGVVMATFVAGVTGVDFDLLDLGPLATGAPSGATGTSVELRTGGVVTQIFGTGFQFAPSGPPTAGTISRIVVATDAGLAYDISGLAVSAATFRGWVAAGDNASVKAGLFAGTDSLTGSGLDDRLRGFAGADTLSTGSGADFADGGDGDDQVFAGAGNDTVVDPGGANYLRGEEGDDSVVGGRQLRRHQRQHGQ